MLKPYIKIQLKSLDSSSFFCYYTFLKQLFTKHLCTYQFFILPKKKKKITLLSSPHVNKIAREQFEITFYKSIFLIPKSVFGNTIDLKFILLNKPKNISIKINIY